MKRTNLFAAAAAVGLLTAAAPASAAVYTLTYQGTVTSGFDTGTFGIIGDLAGQHYTAVYTIDTGTPGATLGGFPGFASLTGQGAASPVKATLTINAITQSYGDFSGFLVEMDGPTSGFGDDSQTAIANAQDVVCGGGGQDCLVYDRQLFHSAGSAVHDLVDADLETAPASHVYGPGDMVFGSFSDYRIVDASIGEREYRARAFFAVEKVTAGTVGGGAVPEPGTWALMILGFGTVGAALRRRGLVAGA